MSFQHIRTEVADGVGTITLNRPPVNILNIEMMDEINGSLSDFKKEKGLKVTTECWLGNAAEEIIGYIRQNRCELVAMTAYGGSAMPQWLSDLPLRPWVFSNVTEQVLATTSRGILLIRGK